MQRGYGLIEVLVALLVLSIGLLGLARLQLTGLRNTHSATLRFEAVNLAYDILDRMRANRVPAVAGHYDVVTGGSNGSGGSVQIDVEDWKAALAASLPDGDGSIDVQNQVATVIVEWSEPWDSDMPGGKAVVRLRTRL
jgi:type IV pilus assembly protein PilV